MTNSSSALEVQSSSFLQQQRQGIRLPPRPEEAGVRASTDRLDFDDRVVTMGSTADGRSLVIPEIRASGPPPPHLRIVREDSAAKPPPDETPDDQESLKRVRDRRISEVRQLLAGASSDDWDGEGSTPLSKSTVDSAVAFLRACPEQAFLSEIDYAADATGDGDVMLTWAVGYDHLFTVLLTSGCQVLHSAVSPTSARERKGVTDWVKNDKLPEGVGPCFDRLTSAIS